MSISTPTNLAQKLLKDGLITEDQLRIAITEQKRTRQPIDKLFVSLGFVTDSVMRDAQGKEAGQSALDLSKVVVDAEAIKLVPKNLALRYKILPITYMENANLLIVAMADILDVVALDQIRATIGAAIEIEPMATTQSQVEDNIDRFYGFELSVDGILNELETGEIDYVAAMNGGDEFSQPIVRLVNGILADAVKRGASDIHLEPESRFIRLRYRIDGVLRQIRILHINYWSAMVVRLKVMANMNIAENRAPQDGRISLTLSGRSIDFRVSCHPTTHGENFVLRVLDRDKGIVALDAIGIDEETLSTLKLMMARPEGIILVTGPTGSGKTTTLYSMLNHLNTESVHIMTLEDPVEYPMHLIRQTSVNESAKLDFANGIRSMMRQDPDIILVGEIRDEDTGEMGFRAAMTGHQVFSTLHTNSALGAIPRLIDIGLKPSIIAGNIIGIVAQRLVRKLCKHCKAPHEPVDIELQLLRANGIHETPQRLYNAVGCDLCSMTGFHGRIALLEVLRMDFQLDELIAKSATMLELKELAQAKGFVPLARDGIRHVVSGETSLEEVSRVIDLTESLG